MTLEDLGNVGEFIGAIGVVVSLLYLALQIRRSTAVARAESEREVLNTQNLHHIMLTQRELIDVWRRGHEDFEGLSKDDKARFHHSLSPIVDRAATVFRMHRDGLVTKETWKGFRDVTLSMLSTPGGRQWWEAAGWTIGGQDIHEEFRRVAAEAVQTTPLTKFWPFYSPGD